MTIPLTIKIILMTWVFGILWPIWPFFGWSSYTYEPFGTSCSVEWMAGDVASVAYDAVLILACYLLPLSIMGYCYGKVGAQGNPAETAKAQYGYVPVHKGHGGCTGKTCSHCCGTVWVYGTYLYINGNRWVHRENLQRLLRHSMGIGALTCT